MQSVPLYLTGTNLQRGLNFKKNQNPNFQEELAIGSNFILSRWSLNLLQPFSTWAAQGEEGQPEQSLVRAVG